MPILSYSGSWYSDFVGDLDGTYNCWVYYKHHYGNVFFCNLTANYGGIYTHKLQGLSLRIIKRSLQKLLDPFIDRIICSFLPLPIFPDSSFANRQTPPKYTPPPPPLAEIIKLFEKGQFPLPSTEKGQVVTTILPNEHW